MNITKIDDLRTIHNEPVDCDNVSENKYLHLMIVLAQLVNVIDRVQEGKEKGVTSREMVRSQYVAGIKSILLLGEEFGFKTEWLEDYSHQKVSGELSSHLLQVMEAVVLFRVKKSIVMYKALCLQYIQLGKLLGFELEEIIEELNK